MALLKNLQPKNCQSKYITLPAKCRIPQTMLRKPEVNNSFHWCDSFNVFVEKYLKTWKSAWKAANIMSWWPISVEYSCKPLMATYNSTLKLSTQIKLENYPSLSIRQNADKRLSLFFCSRYFFCWIFGCSVLSCWRCWWFYSQY